MATTEVLTEPGVSGHIPWEGTKTDAPTGAPSLPSEEGGRPPKIRAVSIVVVVAVQRGGESPGGSPVPELGVAPGAARNDIFFQLRSLWLKPNSDSPCFPPPVLGTPAAPHPPWKSLESTPNSLDISVFLRNTSGVCHPQARCTAAEIHGTCGRWGCAGRAARSRSSVHSACSVLWPQT